MSSSEDAPATKAEVKQIVTEVVSEAIGDFAIMVKHGFDDVDKRMTGLEERMDKRMTGFEERIIREFGVVAESIHVDVAGANLDQIEFIKQKTENHEIRLAAVEERVGL